MAFKHYPPMQTIGIRKVVNGPFTFSPDGNPLVGPVRGLRGFWVACGVMAGLSQGGGVGLALATWMTSGDHGDSGMDIWAMDVARYGDYATLAYTNAKVQENYRRRFRITFPNEELPAARPLLTTPIHDRLSDGQRGLGRVVRPGARALVPGTRARRRSRRSRSAARTPGRRVAAEVAAVRERVGLTEISNYAKYRVTGPGAEAWLSSLLTARMPAARPDHAHGDAQRRRDASSASSRWRELGAEEFYLFGSLPAEVHHSRWFRHHLPADGASGSRSSGSGSSGLPSPGHGRATSWPRSPDTDLSTEAFRFMDVRRVDLGMVPAIVARIAYSGDLGYELWVAPEYQRALFERLMAAGAERTASGSSGSARSCRCGSRRTTGRGSASTGRSTRHSRAGSGGTSSSTTTSSGGRPTRPRSRPAGRSDDSWRSSSTPIPTTRPTSSATSRSGTTATVVGWVTSGGYGHHVKASLALGYVPTALATPDGPGGPGFEIEIIGRRRPARLQPEPLFDPQGLRMRQ